jgi:putative membrane protein
MSQLKNMWSAMGGRPGTPHPPALEDDDRVLLAWHRTHMANERTFLAWCRTSISLLAFGFVMDKFDLFLHRILKDVSFDMSSSLHHRMIYVSLFTFVLGGVTVVFAGVRFLIMRRHIDRGEASFSILPDLVVVLSVIVLVVVVILLSISKIAPNL